MSPRSISRTAPCTPAQARTRLDQAKAFIDVADIVLQEPETVDLPDRTLPAKLRRILAAKDNAHYSPSLLTKTDAQALVNNARKLVDAASTL